MSDLRRRLLMYLASQKKVYIEFEDPEVYRILLANISNDKKGITQKDIDRTKYLNWIFLQNNTIISFDELEMFPVTVLDKRSTFKQCFKLERVSLPKELTILPSETFFNCQKLSVIKSIEKITSFNASCCYGCTSLNNFELNSNITNIGNFAFLLASGVQTINLPKLSKLGADAFGASTVQEVLNLGTEITELPNSPLTWGNFGVFCQCKNLTKVVLPEQLTLIGNRSFFECTSLTDIQFGNNIQTIGSEAFTRSPIINELNFPQLTSLGSQSFMNTAITKILDLGEITTIGNYTFQGCAQLTEVNLPLSLTSIGIAAFNGCKLISNTINLENVTSISSSAFKDCTSLTDVQFGNNIQTIGGNAFLRTKVGGILDFPNLTSLGENVFPQNPITEVKSLGSITKLPDGNAQYDNYGVFWKCVDLTKVTLPETLTDIGDYAFYNCTSLSEIQFGNNITRIGNYAFSGTKLTGILNFPNLTTIGSNAFCKTNITEIQDLGQITIITNGQNGQYSDYGVFYGCAQLTKVVLPETLTTIGAAAFHSCTALTSINFHDNITTINAWGLYNCTSLEGEIVLNSVTVMGQAAFGYCTKITKVVLPSILNLNGAYSMSYGTFVGCSNLVTVDIGDKITSMGECEFWSCANLKNIVIRATVPPTIPSRTIINSSPLVVFYVPDESVEAYKTATNWTQYSTIIKPLSEYVEE